MGDTREGSSLSGLPAGGCLHGEMKVPSLGKHRDQESGGGERRGSCSVLGPPPHSGEQGSTVSATESKLLHDFWYVLATVEASQNNSPIFHKGKPSPWLP